VLYTYHSYYYFQQKENIFNTLYTYYSISKKLIFLIANNMLLGNYGIVNIYINQSFYVYVKSRKYIFVAFLELGK